MKAVFCFFIFVILLLSCTKNGSNVNTNEIIHSNIIKVDLDNAEKKDSIAVSELFKSIKCIPLEFTDNSIIGGIEKILVYKNYIYVLENSTVRNLFVFNMEGHFIRKIGNKGGGPADHVRISDFTIDTDNDELIIMDVRKMLFFDILTGQFKKTVSCPKRDDLTSIMYHNGKIYADLYEYSKTRDDFYLMQSINLSDGKQDGKYLQLNQYNKGWNERVQIEVPPCIPLLDSQLLFRQLFMNIVFTITSQGPTPFFIIESKDFVSEKDLDFIKGLDNKRGLVIFSIFNSLNRKNKIYSISGYFINDEHIYFQFQKGSQIQSALYNNETDKTQVYNVIINDLLYKQGARDRGNFKPRFFDKSGVYEYVNVLSIPDFLESIKKGEINDLFKNQLQDLNEESNPILFYYEFK